MFLLREIGEFLDDLGLLACPLALLALCVYLAFLAAVTRVLNRVSVENRRMEPEQVWLNLIPLLNFVWLPVTVERVGESIRNELVARGKDRKSDSYGKTAGLTGLVLFATMFVAPPAGIITVPFSLIYGVVYWVQIGTYARRLRDEPASYHPSADEGW